MQLGTAACPSPPSQRLIFHATDAKSHQNIWPGVQPPFGVGSHWWRSIAASARLPLPTRVRGIPPVPPSEQPPLGVLAAERGALGVPAVGRKERKSTVLLQLPRRVQQWAGCQRWLEHKSHWAIPPRCHLPLCWCRNPLQGWSYRYVTHPGSYPRWQPAPWPGTKSTALHEP